jgi:hypothetical protein
MIRSTFRNVMVASLLIVAGVLNPSSSRADVISGWDLFQTVPPSSIGPAGFTGVPLNNFNFNSGINGDFGRGIGVKSVSNTDTIIKRLENATPGADHSTFNLATLPGVGQGPITAPPAYAPNAAVGRIDLQVSALQLMSTMPITIGGQTGIFFETLQSNRSAAEGGPGPSGLGIMDITFGTATSGTFNSFLYIPIDLRIGSQTGPIVTPDILEVTTTAGMWNTTTPAPPVLLIPGVNVMLNGTNTNGDFWPQPVLSEAVVDTMNIAGQHTVSPATVPEPGPMVLSGVGALAGLLATWLCRRRAA